MRIGERASATQRVWTPRISDCLRKNSCVGKPTWQSDGIEKLGCTGQRQRQKHVDEAVSNEHCAKGEPQKKHAIRPQPVVGHTVSSSGPGFACWHGRWSMLEMIFNTELIALGISLLALLALVLMSENIGVV
jgi:hypothetical protein